jgi:hypothetical protein
MLRLGQDLIHLVDNMWRKDMLAAAQARGVSMQVGLSTGPLAGIVLGERRRFYCVYGHTVNEAARMSELARPGQMLASAAWASRATNKDTYKDTSSAPWPDAHERGLDKKPHGSAGAEACSIETRSLGLAQVKGIGTLALHQVWLSSWPRTSCPRTPTTQMPARTATTQMPVAALGLELGEPASLGAELVEGEVWEEVEGRFASAGALAPSVSAADENGADAKCADELSAGGGGVRGAEGHQSPFGTVPARTLATTPATPASRAPRTAENAAPGEQLQERRRQSLASIYQVSVFRVFACSSLCQARFRAVDQGRAYTRTHTNTHTLTHTHTHTHTHSHTHTHTHTHPPHPPHTHTHTHTTHGLPGARGARDLDQGRANGSLRCF